MAEAKPVDAMPTPMKLPEVKPLEGKTLVDDQATYKPLRLSYDSAVSVASKIVAPLASRINGHVVIVAGAELLADFANLQPAQFVLDGLTRDYRDIVQRAERLRRRPAGSVGAPAPTAGGAGPGLEVFGIAAAVGGAATLVAPASTLLTAALGVISLFRADVDIHGVATAVDKLAFELEVAAAARRHGASHAYVPDLMSLPLADAAPGSLRARLAAMEHAREAAAVDVAALAAPHAAPGADAVSELFRAVDSRCNDLQTQWSRSDGATLCPWTRLLRAEAVRALNPLVLHCALVATGGQRRVTRTLWRTLFAGDGVSYTGGAIARWALLESGGAVVTAGIASAEHTAAD